MRTKIYPASREIRGASARRQASRGHSKTVTTVRILCAVAVGLSIGAASACGHIGDSSTGGAGAGTLSNAAATTGAGGAEPMDAGDAGMDAAPPPPKAPFDWVGVIGTGQSLSVGATAKIISKTQPYLNLKLVDTGPDPKYPIDGSGTPQWAAVPLVEPIRTNVMGTGVGYGDGQYPDNIAGETPHSGMANTLSSTWKARGGVGDYITTHTVVGWSGHCLSDIDKAGGKRAYPASIAEAKVFKKLADAKGNTFGYGGIVLTHGECDAGNVNYETGLYQLLQDYNTDLKAITGQTSSVVLFASQQSVSVFPTSSATQVWKAGNDHPGEIVCTGPKYQYDYGPDNLHMPAPGYERLGQKYGEVFDLVVNQKIAWKPVGPNNITRSGATITIDFDVPNPPLAWDQHIAPPHQSAHTAWSMGHGFEVLDDTNKELTISSVTLQNASVLITLSAAPSAATVLRVGYAETQDGSGNQGGLVTGYHGQLRDSDEFVGSDVETIAVAATSGSPILKLTGGFVRRAGHDIVAGGGLPDDTIVLSHDSDDQVTLSTPWTGATGTAMLTFHHDEHNYCVHFSQLVP